MNIIKILFSKKILHRVVPLILAFALMSGCSAVLNREYTVRSPHKEQEVVDSNTADLRANSKASLKRAILQLVHTGSEEGVVRMDSYSGDIRHDLDLVCSEICNDDPYGAYAVSYISAGLTTILSRYQANISIIYRREKEQTSKLVQAVGRDELLEKLGQMMRRFDNYAVIELPYYDPVEMDVLTLMQSVYYSQPEYAMQFPSVTVNLYPDSGLRRIIEMEMHYPLSAEEYSQQVEKSNEILSQLLSGMPEFMPDSEKALYLHDLLIENVRYDFDESTEAAFSGKARDTRSWTLIGALEDKLAVSEGYALAYKRMCDMEGLESKVVLGKHKVDVDYAWNVVKVDGIWRHVDVAADDQLSENEPSREWFLQPDSVMEQEYWWNVGSVPSCLDENGEEQ